MTIPEPPQQAPRIEISRLYKRRSKLYKEVRMLLETAGKMKHEELPPNVTIFSPEFKNAAQFLLDASLFTRLTMSGSTTDEKGKDFARRCLDETFSFSNGKYIIIWDIWDPKHDHVVLLNQHQEHFREVCLALKHADIGLDVAGCVQDARTALEAGFQLEKLSSGDVMIIDLLHRDEDEDEDDEDDDDDAESLDFETVPDVDRASDSTTSTKSAVDSE